MDKLNKTNILLKASILAIVLILTSCTNLTTATSTITNIEEAASFVIEKLPINEDDVLIYVWGPVSEGEEVYSTKNHMFDSPTKGYVIYIDLYPQANLFHPVKYIFLSEDTEQIIIKDAKSSPYNYEDYKMIENKWSEIFTSAENRRASIPEGKNPILMKGSSDSRWAVLMNGGYSAGSNHVRYWNDLSNIYITLTNVYGYKDENIIVLCSDGLDPSPDQSNGQNSDPDLDGDGDDDIMYSCVLSNVDMVFSDLANTLTSGSELFIFQTDHGSSNGGWNTLFNLWNAEELTDAHFASLLDALPDCEIICTFEPCFSGGFLDDIVVSPGPIVASSACRHDEYSWAMPPDYVYDEYVFHWTAAVKGEDAYGVPVDADTNEDGIITMDEAFIYAEMMDTADESPQYGDYPEDIGTLFSLWPGSEPPDTPTKPNGPDEWIPNEEVSFTSSTTDPEGDPIYYMFDWGDGNFSDWLGPYASGQEVKATHIWIELGDYEIKVKAEDENGIESNWSEPAIISIIPNKPPEKPTISGPQAGVVGKELEFNIVSTDPEGHELYYMFIWGDGSYSDYEGPYSSGEEAIFSHTWSESGNYDVIAKAKDKYNAKSPQNNLLLSITKNKALTNKPFIRLFENLINIYPNAFPILRQILRL